MKQFAYSALLAGFRGRSIQAMIVLGIALTAFAYVVADFSPRQPQTVALDIGFSFLKGILFMLAIFWMQELVGKEYEQKTVLVAFTYPVPRSGYLIGRWLGVSVLLLLATTLLSLLLWAMVLTADFGYAQSRPVDLGLNYWVAVFGFWLSAVVVASVVLCLCTLSTVALLPVAVGGLFAIASSTLGPVLDFLREGAEGDAQLAEQFHPLLDLARWILPDLSRLDWRAMSLYELEVPLATVGWSVAMAAGYAMAMLALAVLVAGRRDLA